MTNSSRTYSNIALIGFMGCGKSTVGQLVAYQLGFKFVDTDALIEEEAGTSISQIFADQGEEVFRQMETRVVDGLAERQRTVIATGGGVGANLKHLEALKAHSLVICLWASPEVIYRRVKNHAHRPLLQEPDPLKKIEALLSQREPVYREADVLLHSEFRPLREVAQQVIHHFEQVRQQSGS